MITLGPGVDIFYIDVVQLYCAQLFAKKFTFTIHRTLQKIERKRWEIVGRHELRSVTALREIDPRGCHIFRLVSKSK
jgi:hypothetical protein